MNNLQPFFKTNIQTFLFVFAIIILALSNTYLMVQAQEQETNVKTVLQDETNNLSIPEVVDPPFPSNLFPHSNCTQKLILTTSPSNVYDGSDPYNLSFQRGDITSNYQDINGDNLPDYVMAYSNTDSFVSRYEACVYLNTGSGWQKEYACYAFTQIDPNTSQFVRQEYYGDCAGTPASNDKE